MQLDSAESNQLEKRSILDRLANQCYGWIQSVLKIQIELGFESIHSIRLHHHVLLNNSRVLEQANLVLARFDDPNVDRGQPPRNNADRGRHNGFGYMGRKAVPNGRINSNTVASQIGGVSTACHEIVFVFLVGRQNGTVSLFFAFHF